jgi:hypothetical protein
MGLGLSFFYRPLKTKDLTFDIDVPLEHGILDTLE